MSKVAALNISHRWRILAFVWAGALVAVLPLLLHWNAPEPTRAASLAAVALAFLAAVLLGRHFYLTEAKRLTRSQAISLLLFIFLLVGLCEFMHHYLVDVASHFAGLKNSVWQLKLQENVMRLDPSVLPHSYRFLPNSFVYWMQLARVKFSIASEIYRSLTMLVLFYALYRWGRLFTTHLGGLISMLLVGLVYPVSFFLYAGQLTDPFSHLSFLLAFIFLETDEYFFFLSALLIGSLAKETVLGLLGFYVLFARKEKGYFWKAPLLVVACLAAYFGVRSFVLHGMMQYQQVSGVNLRFVLMNVSSLRWPLHFLLTALIYLPFLALGWKDTPLILKRLTFYLLPLLLISSMLFSWLHEARNYMPLVFVLAVVAARFLISQQQDTQLAARHDA